MLIRATSDLHGVLPKIEPCDLLLIAGDVCPLDNHRISHQRKWLEGPYFEWLAEAPAEHVVWIAGNHDFYCQKAWSWRTMDKSPENVHYLRDAAIELYGLRIYGTPWANWIGPWAFMADEPTLRGIYSNIPAATDVVLSHGPPAGWGDKTFYGKPVGSTSLAARLRHVLPRLTVFGHIHEGHGRWDITYPDQTPTMTLVNASLLDEHYQRVHGVVEVEL